MHGIGYGQWWSPLETSTTAGCSNQEPRTGKGRIDVVPELITKPGQRELVASVDTQQGTVDKARVRG